MNPARPWPWTAVLLAVCALVLLLGLGWMLGSGAERGLTVAACALLAALPIGYGIAGWLPMLLATRQGRALDLRWSREALAQAGGVDTIVLDRDGTVTTGELTVVSVDPVETDHDRNLRWFAGALEHASDHPVGRAIARLATRGHLTHVTPSPGLGISGSVDRHPVRVGRPDWIGLDHPGGDGITVAVEVDARALGHITVDDVVREDAAASVTRLRSLELSPVLVSDGTSRNTDRLASAVGIADARAEVSADKREAVVSELASAGHSVAFVGEPAANAAALDACDLPISRGEPVGSHAIGLNTLDVSKVAAVLALGRSTRSIIGSNQIIALVAPALGLIAAGAGVLTPVTAAGYLLGSTFLVVGNSLRLFTREV